MKKIFLLFVILISVAFSAIDECKTDVYFGNGILTDKKDAISNTDLLEKSIKKEIYHNNEDLMYKHIGKVDYAYNRTIGDKGDLWESFYQIIGQQENVDWWANIALWFVDKKTIHSIDIKRQVDKYEASIKSGHRVLVVAHSQGNLFAHEAYEKLGERSADHGKWLQKYWEAISIASPDPYTDIKPDMPPRIGWNNDLVARIGYGGSKLGIDCNVVHVTWEADPHPINHPIPPKPHSPYVNRAQIDSEYKDWWKATNGWRDNLDTNVHAFTFYMGLPLKEGDDKKPNAGEEYRNAFDDSALTDDAARAIIMDQIDEQLKKLQQKPSQWKVKRELGCVCNEKYAVMMHRFDPHGMDKLLKDQKIKNFAGDGEGKIYQADGIYVRATCGGSTIKEIDEGDACLALESIDEARLGVIEGLKGKPEPKPGVVEVTARWSKPELDYDLIVRWDAGETDIKDTGCPMEHYYISSEKVIYPGKRPVWIIPKDPTDPVWDDPHTYPHTFSVQISTPGKGANAQWTATATIGSRA